MLKTETKSKHRLMFMLPPDCVDENYKTTNVVSPVGHACVVCMRCTNFNALLPLWSEWNVNAPADERLIGCKAEHLYSALHGIQTTLKCSGMDHTVFNLQRTPCQPLPRKRSPYGASTECGGGHLIAAHYSFIDPKRMKG